MKLNKIGLSTIVSIFLANNALASNSSAVNIMTRCESVTGIFLYENLGEEKYLNTYIKLEGVSNPYNYTNQISSFFKKHGLQSKLEIGCLANAEGIAIRYEDSNNNSTIIQIDNDGRLLNYKEKPGFKINVEKAINISED